MATANLNLEQINGSDYVSPTVINDNFSKCDVLGKCYVVASGKSGDWWYRKWSDGRAECGIDDKSFGNLAHTTPAKGWYSTAQQTFGAYPSVVGFISRPFASVSFNSNGSNNYMSFVSLGSTTSSTEAPKFVLNDPNSGTINDAHFGIYVTGRWR